jgi:hypothetical protein
MQVGYGSYDFLKQSSGLINIYSLKNGALPLMPLPLAPLPLTPLTPAAPAPAPGASVRNAPGLWLCPCCSSATLPVVLLCSIM